MNRFCSGEPSCRAASLGCAYLLAAGRGRRAGGPKAWKVHEGKSLLERQTAFLLTRLPPSSVAVSIQGDWIERCRAIHPDIRWVPVDPDSPPLASLQALLKVLPMSGWSSLHHVDMPVWEAALFDALERAAAQEAVIPVYNGKGGHPILLSPSLAEGLAALDPANDRLDLWLKTRKVLRAEVPFPCARENWNTP
jgi:CTP:molybdopterin cytidylyltransferase MocA